jgi:hypothetical protein
VGCAGLAGCFVSFGFVLYVGGAVLGVPQDGLWGRLLLVFALFFGVCWHVAAEFFAHAVHGSMLNWLSCECGSAW